MFAAYAAPIVLSGEATFAGYIKLDDTATWMAFTDRVMERGRDLDGLAPSTYEATLAFNLGDGYPAGVFVPLGVGRRCRRRRRLGGAALHGALAALLALALWSLTRPLVASARAPRRVAFIAAQSALLFGYYLWGGIKELAAAMPIASVAACLAGASRCVSSPARCSRPHCSPRRWRRCSAPAASSGWRRCSRSPAHSRFAASPRASRAPVSRSSPGSSRVLALPALTTGGVLPPTASPLTDAGARGNLIGSLEPAQLAGVWPAGDFRLEPVRHCPPMRWSR